MNNIKKHWHQTLRLYALWTLIFTITFLLAYQAFLTENRSFLWSVDGLWTWYPTTHYRGRFLREIFRRLFSGQFAFPMLDLRSGLGDDVFRNGHSVQFHVFAWLGMFVPAQHTEMFLNWLAPFQFWLAGIALITYLKYMETDSVAALIGAVTYVFSGYALFWGIRHSVMFIYVLVYLPLLLIGLELIFKKRSALLFTVISFLFWLHGYYFYFMVGMFFVPYVLIRIHQLYPFAFLKNVLVFGSKSVFALVISLLMAGFYILPQLIFFFGIPSRAGGATLDSLLFYSPGQYISRFMFLIGGGNWSNVLFFPAILFPAILWGMFSTDTTHPEIKQALTRKHLMLLFASIFAIAFIPVGSVVMHGFSYYSSRWMFLIAFVASVLIAHAIPSLLKFERKLLYSSLLLAMVYGGVILLILAYRNLHFILGFIFLLTVIAVLVIPLQEKHELTYKQYTLLALICMNVIVMANLRFSNEFTGAASEFITRGTISDSYLDVPHNLRANPESISRVDVWTVANTPLIRNYYGLSIYSSVQNPHFLNFLQATELGAGSLYFNVREIGRTAALNTLASVRYQIANANSSPRRRPYGFSHHSDFSNMSVFVNDNYLPFGFTYTYTLSEAIFMTLDPVTRAEVMLTHLVLEQGPEILDLSQINTQAIPFEIIETHNSDWSSGVWHAGSNNSMVIGVETPANSESFVRLTGFGHYSRGGTTVNVEVNGLNFNRAVRFESNNFFSRRHHQNFMIPIGHWEESLSEIAIGTAHIGEFTLENIEVFSMPMDYFSDIVSTRRTYQLDNLSLLDYSDTMPGLISGFSGEISVSSSQYLFISIPYSSGWRATINGVSTPVLRANVGFMAIALPEGQHFVELRYRTPGLMVGLVATGVGALGFGLLLKYERKEKGKNIQ